MQTRPCDIPASSSSRLRRCVTLGAVAALTVASSAYAAGFKGASVPSQTDTVSSSWVAPVKVACPSGTNKGCTGRLTLKTSKPVNQGSSTSVAKLGSATFSIAPGKTSKVKVKLDSEGRQLLGSGELKPIATASSRDGAGSRATHSKKITLKKTSASATPPPSALY